MPRGNPNWGKDVSEVPPPVKCAFELKVEELGLTPDQYLRSEELKAWAAVYKNTRYIPESLLKAWRLVPDSSF